MVKDTRMFKLDTSIPTVIFGLGREGKSTYEFLRYLYPTLPIHLVDDQDILEKKPDWAEILENDSHAEWIHAAAFTPPADSGTLFKSAGIAPTHPVISQLPSGWTLSSNADLAFRVLHAWPEITTIGVTGTKGKSTATSAIYHVLRHAGKNCSLAGNIGVPPLSVVLNLCTPDLQLKKQEPHLVVLELSSHQLLSMHHSPHIGVLLDITPEHLDYYPDFDTYANAKNNIAAYQQEADFLFYSPTTQHSQRIASLSKGTKYTLGFAQSITESNYTVTATSTNLYYNKAAVVATKNLAIVGKHTLVNLLPSIGVAHLLGIPVATIAEALETFTSLPHRLEFVATKNGVAYYNDSQGTTPEAQAAALETFAQKPVVLIAGGSDKGIDMKLVAENIIAYDVRAVILFPPTGEKIAENLQQLCQEQQKPSPPLFHVSAMKDAVTKASSLAKNDWVVLLSPACASFGIFRDYQDRGNQFKECVGQLQ